MALILNKEITEVTVDDSGVTHENFVNLNYSDSFGVTHDDPYLVIDEISLDKKSKYARIAYSIYHNKEARISGKEYIFKDAFGILDVNYDTYFSMEIINENNIFKIGYNYLSENKFKSWKSDEIV